MTTSAISSSLLGVSTTSSSSTDATTSTDEFLTMLLAELNNQDPTNPTDSSELTSQLATLTEVEQSIQTNTYLGTLTDLTTSVNNAQAATCIGKTVTVDTSSVAVADGSAEKITFKLAGDAANATITVKDSSGNTVRTISKTDLSSGVNSVSWDGKDNSGNTLDDGTYTITVSATSSSGTAVTAATSFSAEVTGVLYSGGTPYLVTDSGNIPYGDITAISAS